jgi:hypothetical protein
MTYWFTFLSGSTAVDTERVVFTEGTSVPETGQQGPVTTTPLNLQQPSLQPQNNQPGPFVPPSFPGASVTQGPFTPPFSSSGTNGPSQPPNQPPFAPLSSSGTGGPGVQNNQPIQSQVLRLPDAGYEIMFISNLPQDLTWVDVHYSVNGGMTMNFRCEPSSPRRFGHRRILLNDGDVLRYSFTYDVNGLAVDSQMFEFRGTAGAAGPSTPQNQPPQGQPPQNVPPQFPSQPQQQASGINQQGPQTLPPSGINQQGPQIFPSQIANQFPSFPNSAPFLQGSTNCPATDYECQLRRTCESCTQNPSLPTCLSCATLNSCSTTACQINAVCSLCRSLPSDAKPSICNVITGC